MRVCLSTIPRTFCTAAAPVFREFHHGERYFPTAPPFPLNDSAPATSVAVSSIIGVKQPNSIELQWLKNDEERAILCSSYTTMVEANLEGLASQQLKNSGSPQGSRVTMNTIQTIISLVWAPELKNWRRTNYNKVVQFQHGRACWRWFASPAISLTPNRQQSDWQHRLN